MVKCDAFRRLSLGKKENIQMVTHILTTFNRTLAHEDFGKLLLRLAVGGLMLFHGVGEVLAPCLIILGIATRPAALVLAFTMIVAWLMVGTGKTWLLDNTGAWAIENLMYFFVGALAVACLGAGRYALGQAQWR